MSGYEKPKESSSTAYSVNQGSYDAEEARYRTQQEVLNFGPVGPSLYESKDRPRRDVCKLPRSINRCQGRVTILFRMRAQGQRSLISLL